MSARIRRLVFGPALILAAACGRAGGEAAADETAAPTTAVDQAVAVARALRANPPATDSILAAHGLTRAGFDSLMYAVAADAALARAYTEALR